MSSRSRTASPQRTSREMRTASGAAEPDLAHTGDSSFRTNRTQAPQRIHDPKHEGPLLRTRRTPTLKIGFPSLETAGYLVVILPLPRKTGAPPSHPLLPFVWLPTRKTWTRHHERTKTPPPHAAREDPATQ